MPERNDGGLGAIGDAQLGEYAADVVPDRAFGEKQVGGDVGVGLSICQQTQYFVFARAKRLGNG